jgi:hypothetical protein
MDITSTSNPSLAKPPVSFAIHIDAMVPEVSKYAIRNGRVEAACISVTVAIASVKEKGIVNRIRHRELILLFIAKPSWI